MAFLAGENKAGSNRFALVSNSLRAAGIMQVPAEFRFCSFGLLTRGSCKLSQLKHSDRNSARRWVWAVGLSCTLALAPSSAQDAAARHAASPAGEQIFSTTCAGCHGLDGRGSERAPGITSSARIRRLSDKELANIISNGVSGTGMPAFHSLSTAQVQSLVSYIRALQGNTDSRVVPGDATRGKEIFVGKGECSSCHAFAGQGGFLGPDLTSYGAASSSKQILEAIIDSNRIVPSGYKSAVAITRDGSTVEGIVRNEDNFSVQLQTQDGAFHFFQKSDLQKFAYSKQPLMPSNYGQRLNQGELNDLVSFLMGTTSSRDKVTSKKAPTGDDAE